MLRNALAVVGLYVVSKKAFAWYQEYRFLKNEHQRRESQATQQE